MTKRLDYVNISMDDQYKLHCITVTNNGEKVDRCIEALAGANGYAACYALPLRYDSDGNIVLEVIDGNIEILYEEGNDEGQA